MNQKLIVFLLLIACPAISFGEETGEMNPTCPVMLDEDVNPDLFLYYRGVRVYVCCEACVDDFKDNPEEYVPHLPPTLVAEMIPLEEWEAGGGWGQKEPTPAEEHPLGALHPVLVHFPLALTLVAALTALLGLVVSKTFFRNMTTFLIALAALSVVPSFLTGEEAELARGAMTDSLIERVQAHGDLGLISMYVVIGAAVFQLLTYTRPLGKPAFRIVALVLILGAAAVAGYAGYLGGEVIRGPDHLKHVLPF